MRNIGTVHMPQSRNTLNAPTAPGAGGVAVNITVANDHGRGALLLNAVINCFLIYTKKRIRIYQLLHLKLLFPPPTRYITISYCPKKGVPHYGFLGQEHNFLLNIARKALALATSESSPT